MGFEELLAALQSSRTIQDHPDWPAFAVQKFPQRVSFYYTSQDGQEAYWDQARVVKLDLMKLHLVAEGTHGDPLKFDLRRIMHLKDAQNGQKHQDLVFELIRMWEETYTPTREAEGK